MKFTSFSRLFGRNRRRQARRTRNHTNPWLGRNHLRARPVLEDLEDRTLLSVLPTPQISHPGPITTPPNFNANTNYSSPMVAVDPLNPNDVVTVFVLRNDMATAPKGQHSFIEGRFSNDGGQTWTPLSWNGSSFQPNLLDPNPATNPYPPNSPRDTVLQDVSDPSVAFDRNHCFYVVYSEHSRSDQEFGTIVLSKFSFPSSGIPVIQPVSDPNYVPLTEPYYLYTKQLYTWGYQGNDSTGIGFDSVLNPVVTVDNNLAFYRDPITGGVQQDPYGYRDPSHPGTVYVTFNTNYEPPPGAQINPNAILIMASSDGGMSFSTPKFLNATGFSAMTERDSYARLAISQGTSNIRPSQFGQVTGGQVTAVWDEFGTGAGRNIRTNTIAPPANLTNNSGNIGYYGSGSLTGTCIGPGRTGTAMDGEYCDALHPMSGPDMQTTTLFPLNSPVALDPASGPVTGINVTLDMEDRHLDDVMVQIVSPTGMMYTLFNNHVNADGTTNNGVGFTNVGQDRNLGVSSNNTAIEHSLPPMRPVILWDSVFDPLAPRVITQTANPAVMPPYSGHFRPEGGGFPSTLPINLVNGVWQLRVTVYRDNSMEMNHFQKVWKWGITFTQQLATPNELLIPDVVVHTGAMNPAPLDPPVGAKYGTLYPQKPDVYPMGIGPTPVIASDNTLGTYSPHQGRLYLAYTGLGFNNNRITAQPHPDDFSIFLYYSDNGGLSWTPRITPAGPNGVVSSDPEAVNDDDPLDGFSEGNRPQFDPQLAVDQTTGTVVVSYRDARYDASRDRVVTTIATSIDGGRSFQNALYSQGRQPYVNVPQTALDAITGQTVNVQPLPDNMSVGNGTRDTLFGWGDYMGLAVAAGHIYPVWAGNANGNMVNGVQGNGAAVTNLNIYTAQVVMAAGPRVIGSTMGPVTKGTALLLQDGTTPVPYNATYAPDGTEMVDSFIVTFDRPIADGRMDHGQSLSPADITVIFHDPVTPQSQLGTVIPVLSVTPLYDNSTTAPLPSLAAQQYFGADQFLVRFQPQSRVGTYSYVIGPNANNPGPRDLIRAQSGDPAGVGNQMDQNANAIPGELATSTFGGDTYAAPAPANNGPNFLAPYDRQTLPIVLPGPHVVTTFVSGNAPTPDNLVTNGLTNNIDIVFDRDMDPNSIDFRSVLRMVGPAGPILGPFSITPDPNPGYARLINGNMTSGVDPDPSHPRTYKITFPAQQVNGTYTISLAPTIRSENGDQVDVNLNAGVDILRDVPSGGTRDNNYVNLGQGNTQTATTITSPITVNENFVIQGVTLGLTINTQDVRDLSAYLQAPDGTRVQLFTNVGGSGATFANFTHTVFSDSANGGPGSSTNPIQGGQAPFSGTYNPQQPLSALVGKASAGTFLLVITSRTSLARFGTNLVTWTLTLTRPIPISGLGELSADQTQVNFRIFNLAANNPTASKTWTAVGPASIGDKDPATGQITPNTHSGRIGGIAVDPSDPSGNTAFVAGASGGVWKTTNFLTTDPHGPTYVPLTNTAPTLGLNIGSIAVFGRNNDTKQSIVFVATGEGDTGSPGVGLLRSLDGGATWTLLDSTDNTLPFAQRDHLFVNDTAFRVVADPTATVTGQAIVYVAMSGPHGGIWRSTDTGNTWTLTRAGQATDVLLAAGSSDASSGNARILYGAFQGDGVYLSDNQGGSWQLMGGGRGILWYDYFRQTYVSVNAPSDNPNGAKGRITLAAPAPVPSTAPNARVQNLLYQGWLYALVATANGQENGLYVTKDFGQNWTRIKVTTTPQPTGFVTTVYPSNNENDPELNLLGTTRFPQGNYNQMVVVDPTNPNVVYIGGTADGNPTALIRVDITGVADAHMLLAHNNTRNDGGQLEPSTTGATVLGGGPMAQEGPYGLVDPTQSNLVPPGLYSPTGYVNLINDPFNPFLFDSTLVVANEAPPAAHSILSESNLGIQPHWVFYDAAIDGTTDLHRVYAMLDPITGKTRLIFGDDQGIFSVIDPGDGTANFLTGIGTAQANADPSRNGNLQITQFYGGAAQPSQLAANIANALLYGEAQDDGFPLSDPNLLRNGNLVWTGVAGDGTWIGTDPTGSGGVYESRWPCCNAGEQVPIEIPTNFFRYNQNSSRTSGLFLNPPPDLQNWPNTPSNTEIAGTLYTLNGAYAAVNPVNGNQLVITSAIGNVFRTDSGGFQWFLIGPAASLDSSAAIGLAYGAPDPRDPTGATDNFIWAGTAKGHVFVTLDGGGTWTNVSAGLDGSPVLQIVTNPTRGSHEAYAVTPFGVYHLTFDVARNPSTNRLVIAGNPVWENVTGNLFSLMHVPLGDPSFSEGVAKVLTTIVADWRFAILDNPSNPTGPTHPVLYVGGNSGVFRSLDKGKTWTVFPDVADDGAPVDGGYLPNMQITHLDLAVGDINPQTGLPLPATSPDMLFASTYGQGMFAIRLPAPKAVEEVFVVGLDNRVYGQHLDSRGSPGGPYFQTSLAVVKSIASGHDAAGRPVVFALGLDNQVYFQRFDLNGNAVGDFAATAPGVVKSYTVSTDGNGNPELFAVGLDDNVYAVTFDANDNPAGAYFKAANGSVKSLTVGHDAQGNPELFVIGLDNQVYARRLDANGKPLPGEDYFLTQAGAVKSISVGQNSTGQPEVFAIGLDNQVYAQQFDDNGQSASGWFLAVTPPDGGRRLVASLAVGHDANNNPIVFVTGLDNQVYLGYLDANGNSLGSDYKLAAPGVVKGFKVGNDANNIPELFALGLDDQVYYELFSTPGNPTGTYRLLNPGKVKQLTVTM